LPAEPLSVPDDLWADRDVERALVDRDIASLFRVLMRDTGASQARIGAAVGLEQGYVSRIMAGRKVASIDVLERIADGLNMPNRCRHSLGLAGRDGSPQFVDDLGPIHPGPGISGPRSWHEVVNGAVEMWRRDVNRRDVLRQAAFSPVAYAVPALRWFTSSTDEPVVGEGHRLVGPPDVDTIREVTSAYRRLDNEYGGGHGRDAVARYLDREVAPLLREGRYAPPTGKALLSSTAELVQLAGWQAYDVAEHAIAQRYFVQALNLAGAAEDESLGAEIMAAMSHQATYLVDTDTGIDLARAAGRAAKRAGVQALVAEAFVLEAHAHARTGDGRGCATALHAAETALDRADRSADPQWITYFGEAYLSAKFAHCFRALGNAKQAERFAVRSLRMDQRYVRGRAFNLALLASVYVQQNEPDRAAGIGVEAVRLTARMKSARAVRYIRDLQRELGPHRRRPTVRRFLTLAETTLGRRR
jgi:transcriptional regulator with XRE-family HTH domain